ncbi:MAG: glycosyltransferase [Nitrospirae bacterium]|nr:glycosyltransferase [Nitrospirota bacterium]
MVKYSVIVPAYNSEFCIRQCLSSLIDQSLGREHYEIIVVDDGSTDGTANIIREFEVKYLWEPNSGPAKARNYGAREAAGEIILFTDSDCVPSHNWIEEMVKPFKLPDVIAVKGAYKTSQTSLVARFAQVEFEERFEILKKAESIDMVDTYAAAFRLDIFRKFGGFDESFPVANNEDTELSYKLSSAGHRMVFNPDAIVFHLRHPDTLYKYSRQKFWRGFWRMVVYKRFPGKVVKDTYTPQSLKFQILSLFGGLLFIMLAFVSKGACYPAALFLSAFVLSAVPYCASAMKKDLIVGLLSPFLLAARASSIGLGIIYYFTARFGRW